MAVTVYKPEVTGKKEIKTRSGLLLPPSAQRSPLAYIENGPSEQISRMQTYLSVETMQRGFAQGYVLDREPSTRMWLLPGKGTGWDDVAMAKIINGEIANVGSSGVISALASSIVLKHIAQATSAEVVLVGRETPTRRAKAGIARFNDSPMGVTAALQQAVYQLNVFNRGCPIATIPIIYPVERWSEFGMTLVPMLAENEKESEAMHYYIDMDWSKLRYIVPFMPSVFDIEPTGLTEWPYWYRVMIDGKYRWVLLHSSQIVQLIPGYSTSPGIGTSSSWLCTEQYSIYMLVKDAEIESIINAPTSGFIGISGVSQDADEVMDKVIADREVNKAKGSIVSKGFTIFTSEKPINFKSFSFRDVQGFTREEKMNMEDRIVSNFRETLAGAGLARAGVGYAGQSEVNRDMASDSGVGYPLKQFAVAVGSMPTFQNISVSVNRPNDFARARLVEDFQKFASAISSLPVNTLQPEEVRALIESFVGIQIPLIKDSITTSPGATDDQSDPGVNDGGVSEKEQQQTQARRMQRLLLEYYKLKDLASIQSTLEGSKGNALYRAWQAALRKQYKSARVRNILRELENQSIAASDPAFVVKAAPIVEKETDKLSVFVVVASMIAALEAIAVDGRIEAEDQARKEGRPVLSARQRAEINRAVNKDMSARLDELLVTATLPPDEERDVAPIRDQRVKQILDVESFLVIASLLKRSMLRFTSDTEIESDYLNSTDGAADGRAGLITDTEGGRAYTNSFSQTGRQVSAIGKRWNMTTSASPRDIHLATVGEVVGIDEAFSSGDNWSQERVGCKCSITLLWRR